MVLTRAHDHARHVRPAAAAARLGSSYAIHVMARYYEQTEGRTDRIEVVVRAFERVWVPLLISALTTAIGFGSLMVNRIPAIFELGRVRRRRRRLPGGDDAAAAAGVARDPAGRARARSARAAARRCSTAALAARLGARTCVGSRSSGAPCAIGVVVDPACCGRSRSTPTSSTTSRRTTRVRDRQRDDQRADRRLEPVLHRDRGRARHDEALGGAEARQGPPGATSTTLPGHHVDACRSSTISSCSRAGLNRASGGDLVVNDAGRARRMPRRRSRSGRCRRTSSPCSSS